MNIRDPFYINSDDVEQLMAILEDGLNRKSGQDPTIGAIRRLADLRAHKAIPLLRQALSHSNIAVKINAALALHNMNDEAGLKTLINSLSDDKSVVSSLRALAKTKDAQAIEAVQKLKISSRKRSCMFNGEMTSLERIIDEIFGSSLPEPKTSFTPPTESVVMRQTSGKICSRCGTSAPIEVRFCGKCGNPLESPDAKPDAEKLRGEKSMRDRMFNILNLIKAKGSCIDDFQEESDGSFDLKTSYSEYDHQTWLKYEPTNDGKIIRMELTHLFGYLDISEGIDANQLLRLFSMNIPSFQGTSAYLGIRQMEGNFFTSLNTAPIFSAASSDADIAEGLWLHLFDLLMGLIVEPPSPIKQFGV